MPQGNYQVFGGPLDGRAAPGSDKLSVDRPGIVSGGKLSAWYSYRLVQTGGGGRAYVPDDDHDLVIAFEKTGGRPGQPAVEALLTEIQRRELGF